MSQSLSWIDPSALTAALSRAGFDPSRRQPSTGSPTWMPGFTPGRTAAQSSKPSTASPPRPPAPSAPVAAAQPSAAPAVAPVAAAPVARPGAEPPPPTVPELKLDSDRLDRRLEAYLSWVEDCTSCRGLFIVDDEGLVLMERQSDPNLVALSAYFLNLKDRIPDSLGTRSEGSIAIDLDDERVLHVIQSDTRLGPHALGFTVPSPLHRDLTHSFQQTLAGVFAGTG